MPDRDKIVNGLMNCIHYNGSCCDCPYDGPNCRNDVLNDAISMLKEHETAPIKTFDEDGWTSYYCGNCGSFLMLDCREIQRIMTYPKYCSECGRRLNWNERNAVRA